MRELFERLSKSEFRNKFKLDHKDLEYIETKGLKTIEFHAREFILKRISPAYIKNDGKQTPFSSHPVFKAQHASATCCRKCLKKWHNFDEHVELDLQQQEYIVKVIMHWIRMQVKVKKQRNNQG